MSNVSIIHIFMSFLKTPSCVVRNISEGRALGAAVQRPPWDDKSHIGVSGFRSHSTPDSRCLVYTSQEAGVDGAGAGMPFTYKADRDAVLHSFLQPGLT